MTSIGERGLAIALLRASDWFNDALLARLVDRGWPALNRSQSLTFANLDPHGSRPAELARRVGISRQSMQKLIEELVDHGLVTVAADPDDRRAKVVMLTPRGRRLTQSAADILQQIEAELADRVGHPTVSALRRALDADWGPPPVNGP